MPMRRTPRSGEFSDSTSGVNRKQSEWAKTARYICARLIDNGLGGMLILGATVVGTFAVMAYGMTSPDRKEVMLAILGWPFFGIVGWLFAFMIFFVCRYTHAVRDRTHTTEMNRNAEVKNQAVQAALPFELKSSESTPTEPQ
jgi:hypothetical protein